MAPDSFSSPMHPSTFSCSLASDDSIQAWIEGCVASLTSHPFVVDEDAHHFDALMSSSNDFTTPTKRRRPGGGPDDDQTPRPTGPLSARPYFSASDSSSRSSGRSSGRASPTKKERTLRQTSDFPVRRIIVTQPGPALEGLPTSVLQLMQDLKAIGRGTRAVIPNIFQERMSLENYALNQPEPAWFVAVAEDADRPELAYGDRRLRSIWASSLRCTRQSEHEAGWNDSVHGPLLDEALRDLPNVERRNITSTRISPNYRDSDPELGETKIDYGIFLEPLPDSKLARLDKHVPVIHIDLPDGPQTPLAVSVETKSINARITDGPTQLANWARAQFRHLDALSRPPLLAGVVGGLSLHTAAGAVGFDDPAPVAAGSGVEAAATPTLPVLPLVFVLGHQWKISFAQRSQGETLIFEEVQLGDTNTLEGCYFVLHCLRRLVAWAEMDIRSWWEDVAAARSAGAG